MDNVLVKFIKIMYEQAKMSKDSLDIHLYIANCVGACAYEHMRTGERLAFNLWKNEWSEKFNKLLENNS
mgnify:CR=1 FL=1|jgi:hypothetical protein|nr:MAG TPA: hypothetical protein [Caudoviricetes sp.]